MNHNMGVQTRSAAAAAAVAAASEPGVSASKRNNEEKCNIAEYITIDMEEASHNVQEPTARDTNTTGVENLNGASSKRAQGDDLKVSEVAPGNAGYSNKRAALHDISNSSARPFLSDDGTGRCSIVKAGPPQPPTLEQDLNEPVSDMVVKFEPLQGHVTNQSTDTNLSRRQPITGRDSSQLTSSSMSWKDVDAPYADNPLECTAYVNEMYYHYRKLERKTRPSANYMEVVQRDISHAMRGILVDWMVEVAEEYKLTPDTLFLTVNLIDRILSTYVCSRSTLQLVGITCMLIAAKYEEIYPPNVDDYCYITDNTYGRVQVLEMEKVVLSTLRYNVGTPTTKTFARRYLRVAESSPDDRLDLLVSFLCELTLLDYSFLQFAPSQIAASAVLLANYTLGKPHWTQTLVHYTGYQPSDLEECVKVFYQVHLDSTRSTQTLPAVREKYNSPSLRSIASYPVKAWNPTRMFQDIN